MPVEIKTERKVEKMETKQEVKRKENMPVKNFRAGAVCAAVWNNATKAVEEKEQSTYSTISLERSYKDKTGQWKSTGVLRINDLPKAMLVLNKAYEFLLMEKRYAEAEE